MKIKLVFIILVIISVLSSVTDCGRNAGAETLFKQPFWKQCSKDCGHQQAIGSDYIVGGYSSIKSSSKPWMVKIAMGKYIGSGGTIGKCSGSVINSRFIISAAHCFCPLGWCKQSEYIVDKEKGSYVTVKQIGRIQDEVEEVSGDLAGGEYEYQYDYEAEDITPKIISIFFHPTRVWLESVIEHYSGVYDFALLKTEAAIGLDQQIQPICLPYDTVTIPASERLVGKFLDTGVQAKIAGFGAMVSHKGDKCLTDGHGPRKFHICKDAGLRKPCRTSNPPIPFFDPSCTAPVSGPYGWCKVELFKGDEVPENEAWGFCSSTCVLPQMEPETSYHEEATVTVLSQQRCQDLLKDKFKFPSSPFHSVLELCAGNLLQEHLEKQFSKLNERKHPGLELRKAVRKNVKACLNITTIRKLRRNKIRRKREIVKVLVTRQELENGEIIYLKRIGNEVKIVEPKHESGQRLVRVEKLSGDVGGIDACQGDSGGPIWVDWDGRAVLIGTVSRGKICGTLNRPGIYSRILPSLKWIHQITKEFGCFSM